MKERLVVNTGGKHRKTVEFVVRTVKGKQRKRAPTETSLSRHS